ncbi:MAG: N-acetyltransferase family protein, partial [Halobacteriaceae archaeon]
MDAEPEDVKIRQAELDDHEDVVGFTQDTWDGGDYIPRVFKDWVESDGPRQRTLVADLDGEVIGVMQMSRVSDYEAWAQGMRMNPEYRGLGISTQLSFGGFRWARDQGARIARNMVFSWNIMGLGQSRAVGFEPVAEFRWAEPEPDGEASLNASVTTDPDAAYGYWIHSTARERLSGLALHAEESWCVAELTRSTLQEAANEDRLLVIEDNGIRGFTYQTRTFERTDDDDNAVDWAEYGVGAWDDHRAARDLFSAIRQD